MTSAQEDEARTRPGFSLETRSVIDVFTEVLKRGPIARIDVARRTGLSQSAVTKAIAPLIGRGLLFPDGTAPVLPDGATPVAAQGRPPQPISVNEEAQLILGIIVRVDEIYGVATTIRANILQSVRRPLPSPGVSAAIDGVAAVVESLLSRLGEAAGNWASGSRCRATSHHDRYRPHVAADELVRCSPGSPAPGQAGLAGGGGQ